MDINEEKEFNLLIEKQLEKQLLHSCKIGINAVDVFSRNNNLELLSKLRWMDVNEEKEFNLLI